MANTAWAYKPAIFWIRIDIQEESTIDDSCLSG